MSIREKFPEVGQAEHGSLDNIHQPDSHNAADDFKDFKWNRTVLTNLATLIFLYMATIWNFATPQSAIAFIAQRFPDEASYAAWIATSVTIILSVLQCILGDLSDLLGRRMFLLAGSFIGLVGVLITGCATSLKLVIGGQVLNGIGSSTGYLVVPLLQEMVPKTHRATITAVSVLCISCTGMVAPSLEGVFILRGYGGELDGWRIGIFLLAGSLTTFLIGISFGGNPDPWISARVLGPLLAGFVGSLVFCFWEWKGTSEGIVPHALFHHRNFAMALLIRWAIGAAIFGAVAWGPVITKGVITQNGLVVAVWQFPTSIGVILGGSGSAWAIGHWKECKPFAIGALLCQILGAGLTGLFKPHMNYAIYCFALGFIGIAAGMENVALNTIASVSTPNEMISTACMLVNAMNTFGGAIALTVFASIYGNKAATEIPAEISKDVIDAGFPAASLPELFQAIGSHNDSLIDQVQGVTPQVLSAINEGTKQGYANSSHYVFYAVIGFAAIALIPALWLTSTKTLLTEEVTGAALTRKEWKKDQKHTSPEDGLKEQ